ncbi:MAG: hypothetical protein J5767_10880 [Paludibacteraceae bacterium]|nr:hypothetical protein [Paludibacteraceae bacterium]
MTKKVFSRFLWAAIACTTLLSSCDKEEESRDRERNTDERYSCLIINQGNYSESNGSISIINKDEKIENQVYKESNGEPLASIIESAVDCGSTWALLCNNEDKVEIIDKITFKTKATIKDIPTPRYGVVRKGYLYVTSVTAWDGSNGFVYQIDLNNNTVAKKVEVQGIPEGIIAQYNSLWVTTTVYGSAPFVSRIEPEKDMKVTAYPYTGTEAGLEAKHLAVDKNGTIWVSLSAYASTSGVAAIDTTKKEISALNALDGFIYSGHIYASKAGDKLYYMTGTGSGAADDVTTIKTFDVKSKEVATIVKGAGFYGFGIAPDGEIYTANVYGFTSNSTLQIYDSRGTQINGDNELVGVGACRFLFPKW